MKIKNSIILKMFAIGFLALILLIPTGMIKSLISERAGRKNEAIREVSTKWGENQTIVGPILTVPYTTENEITTKEKDGETTTEVVAITSNVYFLPAELSINGDVTTNLLKRGLYEITAYNSKLTLSGKFSFPDFSDTNIQDSSKVDWEDIYITMSLSDLKALQQSLDLTWGEKKYQFKPGFKSENLKLALKGSGLNAWVPINPDEAGKSLKFSIDIDFNGSESLNFIPLGGETNIQLVSNWPSPSFDGSFLPDERNITDDGFNAKWKVLELNRNYPQMWENNLAQDIHDSSFGVKLLVTVDEYQKNMRSIKYAIMFIALSFLVFFFVEVLNQVRIHPIQYILVGLSLVLFFSLLISITEHLNFDLAYLISSMATVLLVTLYTKTIFKNIRLTLVQGGILSVVYIFIYSIIQMEDYALLMGSVGLFVVLATVMFISRKINWYSIGKKS